MALIAHTIAGSSDGNNVTTSAINTTGADFIMVSAAVLSAGEALTDSYANTWNAMGGNLFSFAGSVEFFYCIAPTVGAGHTFTMTPGLSGKKPTLAVSAWAGVGVYVDESSTNDGFFVPSTSATYPNYTPATVGELSLINLGRTGGDAATPLTGYTIIGEVLASGTATGLTHAYRVAPNTSTITPNWTWTTPVSDRGGGIAMFTYVETPTTRQSYIFGRGAATDDRATVTSDLTVLMNLDELGRTVHEPNTLYVAGNVIVTGTTTLASSALTNPSSILNAIVGTDDGQPIIDSDGNVVFVNGS